MQSIVWTLLIAVNLVLSVVYRFSRERLSALEKYYHAVCWGGSLVYSAAWLLPFMQFADNGANYYGPADMFCWISKPYEQFRLFLFYIPVWVVFIVMFFSFYWVGAVVNEEAKRAM